MLSRDEAKAFYDRFGSKQDSQAFYEDAAIDDLLLHGGFEEGETVYELGCGTGRLADRLLNDYLPVNATYHGTDISSTMISLASERLRPFKDRVLLEQTDGSMDFDEPEASLDRVVTTYVLDLLPEDEIRRFLEEALRALKWDGRLCVAGLCPGTTLISKLVSGVWSGIHRLRPAVVGGCRPISFVDYLKKDGDWEIRHRRILVAYGIASEVVIATPRPERVESDSLTAGVA